MGGTWWETQQKHRVTGVPVQGVASVDRCRVGGPRCKGRCPCPHTSELAGASEAVEPEEETLAQWSVEWPRWHSLPVSEPGWGWRRWGSGFKEIPWLPRGWGQRVGDAGPAGPPQKGEVPFLSPSSACRASAPTSKSCRHRQPRLAASLEDSHFWKSLLCH